MPVSFDDLIPQIPPSGTTFDDLIPSFRERLERPALGPLIPSQTPDQASLWPGRVNAAGKPEFDPQAGVLGSLWRAITIPGDILTGRLATPYSPGASPQASPEVISRAGEFANFFSPVGASYRAGVRYGAPPPNPPPPAAGVIQGAGSKGYNAVTGSGWEVPSSSVETTARTARREFEPNSPGPSFLPPGEAGPGNAPLTYSQLTAMENPKYSSTSIAELKGHYDALTGIISKGGSDAVAANIAREKVAGIINNLAAHGGRPQPGVTPTMTPAEVGSTFTTAQQNWRSAANANRISGDLTPAVKGILETIEMKAQASGNYNVDAPLRNRALAILQDNANVAALLPDEKAALEAVVQGKVSRNMMRDFGRIFGVGNPLELLSSGTAGGSLGAGIGALTSGLLGTAIGGPLGAAVLPIAGTAARRVSKAGTKGALSAAEELIRSNSPFAQEILANLIKTPPPVGRDEAVLQPLLRGLLAPPPDRSRLPPGYI